jgi:hypothetical protein
MFAPKRRHDVSIRTAMSLVSKRINSSRTSDDVDVTLIKSIDLAAPGA